MTQEITTAKVKTKETVFYPRLKAMTDQWTDLFGYWAPTVVTDTLEEYRAVREQAGLMDFSMLRKWDLDGPGARDVINHVVTRDIARLRPGQIVYSALCNDQGKMVDDCTVAVRSDDHIRFCGANDKDQLSFERRAAGTGVRVRHYTDEIGHLCLQGPKSREWLQALTDSDLSRKAFPYYTFKEQVTIAGMPVFMTRLGYTAELGYELWAPADRAVEFFDRLVEILEPKGMRLVGMTALDLLRIEGGFIIGGIEYDETVSPYECALDWAIEYEKGDFQGKAALLKDKEIMVGAIDVATNKVETPDEVASVLKSALAYAGAERIYACSNCGLAPLPRTVAVGKLKALAAGAALLRAELARR